MRYLKNTLLKFFFCYFILTISPWMLLRFIPGLNYITDFYKKGLEWLVFTFNDQFFHVKETLNMEGNGSGDTSYAWAEFYTHIILSLFIALVWSFLEKKNKDTTKRYYILYTLLRYSLVGVCFSYGTIKLFALQMPFPNLSQLATPLGEFLPMRLSWMFLGYSEPYQMFSGVMEIIVGLLLLYRRTISLGLFVGLGVFLNVFIMNLAYDIPVKLFSMNIVIWCLFLLVLDRKRYLHFFVLNKPTTPNTMYNFPFTQKWQKIGRWVLKTGFILAVPGLSFLDSLTWYEQLQAPEQTAITRGIYEIKMFKKNNKVTVIDKNDTLAWNDFIFDAEKIGSVATRDTLFRKRYGRGYFVYEVKPKQKTISFSKVNKDTLQLFVMHYKNIDARTLQLQGVVRKDTLFYELVRKDKKFPLAEKQFHWISEANR